ncbi:MAG: DUF2786 domain-containing protein [Jatrophihabitantaceae bacterium]
MGTQNRARRAAKQRARAQRSDRIRSRPEVEPEPARGADDRGISDLAGAVVAALFAAGWTPLDLVEVARRRLDAAGQSYVADLVAEAAQRYAPATVHPQWRSYLVQSGAQRSWRPEQSHFAQWQERQHFARETAREVVAAVLAMLKALPVLQPAVPAPGTAGWTVGATEPVDERMLAKVRALLAKAESTEFDEEAEALSAKAQDLMTRYSLHRAVADRSHGTESGVRARRIWLDAPYVSAKAMLVNAVAAVNRCGCVVTEQLGFVTIVGDDVDQRVVEILSTSLLVQATRAMTAAGSQISRYGTSRTRSFRHSFLIAYAGRIRERLQHSNDSAAAAEDSAQLLPVLAARSQAVDDHLAELFPQLVSSRLSVSNSDGWHAGRVAADLARLDGRASLSDTRGERAG